MKKILYGLITILAIFLAIGFNLPKVAWQSINLKDLYAGIVSYDTLSGDAGVSYEHFNTSFNTLYNEFNGNIEAVNIKDDSLTEANFADEINPRIRTDENIGDYTVSGHLPATDTDLDSDISAGVSYVNGYRLSTEATSHTYTASKDTWVYIDQTGAFQYEEVVNDGTQPTTPANSLLLAKVVTDSDNITDVTDYRQTTPPNLRVYTDGITGCVISRDISTATTINIQRGEIEFGSSVSKRRNTSTIDIDLTKTGEGGLDTGSLATGFYYVYAMPNSDNSSNFTGIASTSASGTSVVDDERLIGWFYALTASTVSVDSLGGYRGLGANTPNFVRIKYTDDVTLSSGGTAQKLAETSFYSSGRPVQATFSGAFYTGASTFGYVTMSMDGVEIAKGSMGENAADIGCNVCITGADKTEAGEHTVTVYGTAGAGNISQIEPRVLIIEEK